MAPPREALVLIVDDDRALQTAMSSLLAGHGHQVSAAGTADDALGKARALRPDLMLLDASLPDGAAYALCRAVRSDPDLAELPVVLLMPSRDDGSRQRGIDAGADDFLVKPLDRVELLARARTIARLTRYRWLQEAERVLGQIEMAAAIQQQLLPRVSPVVAGLEAVSRYWPAAHVGGDYHDLIVHGDALYFALGDAAGHGLPAALVMSTIRSALRSLLPAMPDPAALAGALNRRLVDDAADTGMFMTTVLGRYEPATATLSLVNCGHAAPVVLRRSGVITSVPAQSLPLGVAATLEPELVHMTLDPGDVLCLHTDGLIESPDTAGRRFGPDRLHDILIAHALEDLTVIAERALEAVTAFHGRSALDDDLTLMLLRRTA